MSIGTFSELKTAVGNWLDRTDLSTTRVPEFIALFEGKVNRKLAVRQQITTTTLTPSSGSASLPTDYLSAKRVTWLGSPQRDLEFVEPTYFSRFDADQGSGNPVYFTIEGGTLKIAPRSTTNLTLAYAQKVPALSDSATTNWLLTSHPDAYLFGSLTMAATFTEDATQGPVWNDLTKEAIGDLWDNDFRHAAPMTMKTLSPTP